MYFLHFIVVLAGFVCIQHTGTCGAVPWNFRLVLACTLLLYWDEAGPIKNGLSVEKWGKDCSYLVQMTIIPHILVLVHNNA